jgi:type I restriction enzyme S subunit
MKTKQLRQKILDLAIHGKLVPQDPADEPASALLKRITKEKAWLVKEGKIKADKKAKPSSAPADKPHYGKLPENWVCLSIAEICEPQETKRPTGETFRYIDIDAIDNKKHCVSESKQILTNQVPSRASKGVCFGDTLFSMVRPYLENIAFVTEELNDCIASTGFYVCRPQRKLLFPKYLYYFLISQYAINGINAYMRGDNSPSVRKEQIDNFIVFVPPLAEQRRIVAAIESAFAVIDEIEQSKGDLQSAILSAKSKILSLAVSGKLVPQDESDEPASALLDRVKTERANLIKAGEIKPDKREKEAVVTRYNSHYGKITLNSVCTLINTPENDSGTLPYLDVRYLRTKSSPDFKQSGRHLESGAAVILVDGENSGEIFKIHESGYMGSTFRELLINNAFDENFVLIFIKRYQRQLRESKTGSAIPHLNHLCYAEGAFTNES